MFVLYKEYLSGLVNDIPLNSKEKEVVLDVFYGNLINTDPAKSILSSVCRYSDLVNSCSLQSLKDGDVYVLGLWIGPDITIMNPDKPKDKRDLLSKLNLLRDKEQHYSQEDLTWISLAVEKFLFKIIEIMVSTCRPVRNGLIYITCMVKEGNLYFS